MSENPAPQAMIDGDNLPNLGIVAAEANPIVVQDEVDANSDNLDPDRTTQVKEANENKSDVRVGVDGLVLKLIRAKAPKQGVEDENIEQACHNHLRRIDGHFLTPDAQDIDPQVVAARAGQRLFDGHYDSEGRKILGPECLTLLKREGQKYVAVPYDQSTEYGGDEYFVAVSFLGGADNNHALVELVPAAKMIAAVESTLSTIEIAPSDIHIDSVNRKTLTTAYLLANGNEISRGGEQLLGEKTSALLAAEARRLRTGEPIDPKLKEEAYKEAGIISAESAIQTGRKYITTLTSNEDIRSALSLITDTNIAKQIREYIDNPDLNIEESVHENLLRATNTNFLDQERSKKMSNLNILLSQIFDVKSVTNLILKETSDGSPPSSDLLTKLTLTMTNPLFGDKIAQGKNAWESMRSLYGSQYDTALEGASKGLNDEQRAELRDANLSLGELIKLQKEMADDMREAFAVVQGEKELDPKDKDNKAKNQLIDSLKNTYDESKPGSPKDKLNTLLDAQHELALSQITVEGKNKQMQQIILTLVMALGKMMLDEFMKEMKSGGKH